MKLNLIPLFSSDGEHKNTSLTVESLQKAFLMIDVNGDGFLSRTEVDEFLTILGDTPSDSTKGKIYNMISDPQRGELVDKFVFEVCIKRSSVKHEDKVCFFDVKYFQICSSILLI